MHNCFNNWFHKFWSNSHTFKRISTLQQINGFQSQGGLSASQKVHTNVIKSNKFYLYLFKAALGDAKHIDDIARDQYHGRHSHEPANHLAPHRKHIFPKSQRGHLDGTKGEHSLQNTISACSFIAHRFLGVYISFFKRFKVTGYALVTYTRMGDWSTDLYRFLGLSRPVEGGRQEMLHFKGTEGLSCSPRTSRIHLQG